MIKSIAKVAAVVVAAMIAGDVGNKFLPASMDVGGVPLRRYVPGVVGGVVVAKILGVSLGS